MPHVVAGGKDDSLVAVSQLTSIFLDIADRPEEVDHSLLAQDHVIFFRFSQAASQRELAGIVK